MYSNFYALDVSKSWQKKINAPRNQLENVIGFQLFHIQLKLSTYKLKHPVFFLKSSEHTFQCYWRKSTTFTISEAFK